MATYDASYVDSDTFTVSGDHTSDEGGFQDGRAVKLDCDTDGIKHGCVESASYSDPNTTVNLDSASDAITSNLTTAYTSIVFPSSTGNVANKLQQISTLSKTSGYSITVNGLGRELRFSGSSYTTLPSVSASEDGSRIILTNTGTGYLKINTSDSDVFCEGVGAILIGRGRSVTLEYCHAQTYWSIVSTNETTIHKSGYGAYLIGDHLNNSVEKFVFATETSHDAPSAYLDEDVYFSATVGKQDEKGYLGGGSGSGNDDDTYQFTYSLDTSFLQTTANLSQARRRHAGVSELSEKGYFLGGYTTSGHVSTADKVTFSTDATAACTTADLSQARSDPAGLSEGSTKGYVAGGETGGYVATADKITFSNDTTAACTTADLSQGRSSLAGLSEGSTKGYFAGGITATIGANKVDLTDKVTFSNDTTAACTTANLSSAREDLDGVSEGSSYGYFAGGDGGEDTIDRVVFSTDTTSALSATLVEGRYEHAGLSETGL